MNTEINEKKLKIKFLIVIIAVVIFDQWTKIYVANNFRIGESLKVIDGFLNFTYVHNTGVAFSIGSELGNEYRMILFKILPVIICLFIAKMLFFNKVKLNILSASAYALIIGGATGNIIDRIRLDYVIDFIAVYNNKLDLGFMTIKEWHFAIFNIADSAVSIAAGLLILEIILEKKRSMTHASTD